MQKSVTYPFIFAFMLLGFISCKKSNSADTRSQKMISLQSVWNFKSTTFIEIGGPGLYQSIPTVPTKYDFNISGTLYLQPSSPPISYLYRLLPDDSTLILTYTNPSGNTVHDTNYISVITSHDLVYHGLNSSNTYITIDSLTK